MVNSVTASSTTASQYMKQTAGLNKDDFLKLFVTQMQNQDPLNPQDSSEFVAQLAQLTQVEQSYNTNTNLQSLLTAADNAAGMMSASFIGKEALAQSDQLRLAEGGTASIGFRLSHAAEGVEFTITDSTGRVVRTIEEGQSEAGDFSVTWDGRDGAGNTLAAGVYEFKVTGINADGSTFEGTPLSSGKVEGVRLDGDTPVFMVNGFEIKAADLLSVKGS